MQARRGPLLATIGGLVLFGCNGQQDADGLARVGQKVAGKIEAITSAESKLNTSWQAVRDTWGEDELVMRVTARLRWDKSLKGAKFEVKGVGDGAIELSGKVEEAEQRRRAVELAEATDGVKKVIDKFAEGGQRSEPDAPAADSDKSDQ